MKINKTRTTVYTLSKEEIKRACYDAYIIKLKDLGISIWFDKNNIELSLETIECKLTIIE